MPAGEDSIPLELSPSADAFSRVCAWLDAAQEDPALLATRIAAAEAALASWPPSLCAAPLGWIDDLRDGQPVAQLAVARSLELSGFDDAAIAAVAGCPQLASLGELSLRFDPDCDTAFDDESAPAQHARARERARMLASAPWLSRLEALRLEYVLAGDGWVEGLVETGMLARLRRLALIHAGVGPRGHIALAESPQAAGLEALDLREHEISPHALRALARSPFLSASVRQEFRMQALRGLREEARHLPDAERWERLQPLLDSLDEAELAGVRDLIERFPDIERVASAEDLDQLLRGAPPPALGRARALRVYRLRGCSRRAEDWALVDRLLQSPALAAVTVLDLRYCCWNERELLALATLPGLRRLRALYLNQRLRAPGRLCAELSRSPHAAGLRDITLCGSLDEGRGLASLLRSPLASRLEALRLPCNHLGDEGARRIAAARSLAGLRVLDLRNNGIGDAGAIALAASPHLRSLRELWLWENEIGDEGVAALSRSPNLGHLQLLELGYGGRIGDAGALALSQAASLGALRHLGLVFNDIGPAGAAALVGAPGLPALRSLDICFGNRIGEEGALAMAQAAGRAPSLRIDLRPGAAIPQAGFEALQRTSLAPADAS